MKNRQAIARIIRDNPKDPFTAIGKWIEEEAELRERRKRISDASAFVLLDETGQGDYCIADVEVTTVSDDEARQLALTGGEFKIKIKCEGCHYTESIHIEKRKTKNLRYR